MTNSWSCFSIGMCLVFWDTQLVWRHNWYVSRVCRHTAGLASQLVCVPCLLWRLNWYCACVWRNTVGLASQLVCFPCLETQSWSGVSAVMCPVFGDTQLVCRLSWYVSRVLATHSWSGVSTDMCLVITDTQLLWRHNWYVFRISRTQLVWRLIWYMSRVWRYTAGLSTQQVCAPCLETHMGLASQLVSVPVFGDTQLV